MALKLKADHAAVIIGFRNKSLPLGQRSEADLNFIYQRAKDRDIKKWLDMFEDGPTETETDTIKINSFNKRRSANKRRKPDEA